MRQRPMCRTARPDSRTLESRRNLHYVSLANPQFHLRSIGNHLQDVTIGTFVTGLSYQSLKPRSNFSGTQVPRGRDEFHPK